MSQQKIKAPKCSLGPVLWSPGPGHPWYAAIATDVGGNAIRLTVFSAGGRSGQPKDAVRHKDDPDFPKLMDQSGGVWDYTPETKLLMRLASLCGSWAEGDALLETHGYARHLYGDGYAPPAERHTVAAKVDWSDDVDRDDGDHVRSGLEE